MSTVKASILPEMLGKELSELLIEWADNEEKEFVKAIDEAAEACNQTAQQYLSEGHGINTGNYRQHFAIDKQWQARHHYAAEWHVEAPEYRLTHLLENGHLTRDGTSRTKPVKHIKYGQQAAEQVLDERIAGLWGG
ncbi:MAG: hypothetical protein HDR09_20070 [Lachnospiraceae bacterium]|nr:hypothetical protein [Lachnospiraceae bacterium]MBD5505972.1 hypothetical protein [Lachnospiraceae bacterium]